MQGMRVAAEPPFRTSLCYRVHHDTEWHQIVCNYLPFSKAAKGAQGGPQQHETPKHSPTDISKRLRS